MGPEGRLHDLAEGYSFVCGPAFRLPQDLVVQLDGRSHA